MLCIGGLSGNVGSICKTVLPAYLKMQFCFGKSTSLCQRSCCGCPIVHWVAVCTFDGVVGGFTALAVCLCKRSTFVVLVVAVLPF